MGWVAFGWVGIWLVSGGGATHSTVSLNTPIRLCGLSCSPSRELPAREPSRELAVRDPCLRSPVPVPAPSCSSTQVKVLRSPQLRRCSRPGRFLRGSVCAKGSGAGVTASAAGWSTGAGCEVVTSDPVMTWSIKRGMTGS